MQLKKTRGEVFFQASIFALIACIEVLLTAGLFVASGGGSYLFVTLPAQLLRLSSREGWQ